MATKQKFRVLNGLDSGDDISVQFGSLTLNDQISSGGQVRILNGMYGDSFMDIGIHGSGEQNGRIAVDNSLQFIMGSSTITLNTSGQIANSNFTIPNAAGSAGQVLKWPSSGSVLEWGAPSTSGTITSATNMVDNRILTASGSTTINGEANLTFTGTQLTVGATTSFNGSSNQMSGTMDFEGDVLFQGDNASIFFDVSDDSLEFSDSAEARFGNSNDLKIYHNTHTFISNTGCDFRITNGTNPIQLRASTIRLQDNAAYDYLATEDLGTGGIVKIYHGASSGGTTERFRTASDGIKVTGQILAETDSILGAGVKLHATHSSGRQYNLISSVSGNFSIYDSDASAVRVTVESNGNVGINKSSPLAKFCVEEYAIDTRTTNTSSTTQTNIFDFLKTSFRSARFTVQITNTTDSTYQVSEILVIHDGTTPSMAAYGTIFTGSAVEATFDTDISGLNYVRLFATPASTDNMTFKVVCHSITT